MSVLASDNIHEAIPLRDIHKTRWNAQLKTFRLEIYKSTWGGVCVAQTVPRFELKEFREVTHCKNEVYVSWKLWEYGEKFRIFMNSGKNNWFIESSLSGNVLKLVQQCPGMCTNASQCCCPPFSITFELCCSLGPGVASFPVEFSGSWGNFVRFVRAVYSQFLNQSPYFGC